MRRWAFYPVTLSLLSIFGTTSVLSWLPDTKYKLKLVDNVGPMFRGASNRSGHVEEHFIVLRQDDETITVGGRNAIYSLDTADLLENRQQRIEWRSSEAYRELCLVKGKTEDDCQNYIRILVKTAPDTLLVCGTNSYKPTCRYYKQHEGRYRPGKEFEGLGICPYDPEHNSTAVFSNNQLYTATVADFTGSDPLIYREPLRTERSDLKQLNAPNFVSSFAYRDEIFFLFRETAVEFINCGKAIYTRIARVCKDDKGGPHQFFDRWTSFLKARLNCSVPGEYPFYFDEIQHSTDPVKGNYGEYGVSEIIYGTFTTSTNAIGGSSICAFSMNDVIEAYEGTFKEQESINSNWLPVPEHKVPDPRPGSCVKDSRTLPDVNINFVKTHSLMERTVPTFFGQPLLIRVSFHYRFTSIAIDPQVRSVEEKPYDILYVGTDNGRVLKIVNLQHLNSGGNDKAIVISDVQVFPNGTAVKGIKVTSPQGPIIVVAVNAVKLVNMTNCHIVKYCGDCVGLQDPMCAWDTKKKMCVVHTQTFYHKLQDVVHGNSSICPQENKSNKKDIIPINKSLPEKTYNDNSDSDIYPNPSESNTVRCDSDSIEKPNVDSVSVNGKEKFVIYTADKMRIVVIASSIAALAVGFVAGYLFSKRFRQQPQLVDTPFTEQHNHLNRLTNLNQNSNHSGSGFLPPRANKAINLVLNVPPPSATVPSKKDNLESSKDLNISNEGTLQKIKKTYI